MIDIRTRFCAVIARATILITLLSGCHSTAFPEGAAPAVYHVSGFDPGGSINGRIQNHLVHLDRARTIVVIDTPSCYSACTFYFALRDACVTPRAVGHFHGPLNGISVISPIPIPASGESGRMSREAMVHMFRELPLLQSWLSERIHQTRFYSLDYTQLVAMGVRACGALEIELARHGRATVELERT